MCVEDFPVSFIKLTYSRMYITLFSYIPRIRSHILQLFEFSDRIKLDQIKS